MTHEEDLRRKASTDDFETEIAADTLQWAVDEIGQLRAVERDLIGQCATLRAAQDAAIRILSDDRMPLQSRVNDARAILARAGHQQSQKQEGSGAA